ncbi:MAG: hypothetical protein ABOK23_05005 [Candidatus Methanoperedens sp.]
MLKAQLQPEQNSNPDEKFNMYPVDGAFDSQREEIFADIDVSKIAQGKHIICVESMERIKSGEMPHHLLLLLRMEISR